MKYFITFLVIFLFVSCGEGDISDIGVIKESAHFPLISGKYIDYEIQNISFSKSGSDIDTSIYYLREVVEDSFLDATGEKVHIIDRFTRSDASASWQYQNSWSANISNNEAVRIEGNLKFVKLKLPAILNEEWDGNKYFDSSAEVEVGTSKMTFYENWTSKYLGINISMEIDGKTYDQVHSIQLANHENRLEKRYGIERYAQGIGLIYKELIILDTQCFDNCQDIPWNEKAEKGMIWVQHIIGNN